jgi:hypothetical protein
MHTGKAAGEVVSAALHGSLDAPERGEQHTALPSRCCINTKKALHESNGEQTATTCIGIIITTSSQLLYKITIYYHMKEKDDSQTATTDW